MFSTENLPETGWELKPNSRPPQFVTLYGNLAMKRPNVVFSVLIALSISCGNVALGAENVEIADSWLSENAEVLDRISKEVWNAAELGFQEHRSSALFADTLEKAGFTVTRGAAGMKTAFIARYGTARPTIAFLAEYDALPGLSQKAIPQKEPQELGRPGHGCGHNLLGTASIGAAIAAKDAIVKNRLPGSVVVFGTPAEEGGGGKVYLVRAGLFQDIDAVIGWHPDVVNQVRAGSSLAVRRMRFRFTGIAAHAALHPEQGRSALDAVELMNIGTNFLREHISQEMRLHYIISRGGERPNVVPDDAENWYYVRGPRMAAVDDVTKRVSAIAEGACLMTRTTVEVRDQSGTYEFLPNRALAEVVHRQLLRVGPPPFDEADRNFGGILRKNLGIIDPNGGKQPFDTNVLPITTERLMASSDIGDVSWVVPTVELRVASSVKGAATHTWAFAATAGGPIGQKGCRTAALIMASAALDLVVNPKELIAVKEEFANQTRGFKYVAAIPERAQPPEQIDP
jgi:aminobenzoyl-glutamate utilization protein B